LQATPAGIPAVAIIHSSDLIEDWLDHLDLSLQDLTEKLMGSWTFGYAAALSRADVGSILVLITRRVDRPERRVHEPTGAVIWLLPPPRAYSLVDDALASPRLRASRLARAIRQHVVPYLATPFLPLARVLRADGCRAIVCQEYECPRFDVLVPIGRLIGLPVFPCYHAGDGRSGFEGLLHPITMRACAGVIVSADFEASRVQRAYRVPTDKLARIPNPLDHDVWKPEDRDQAREKLGIPADALVAIWHGAVYLPAKGLDVLAAAWKRVTRSRPGRDLRLVLVGGGADTRTFARLVVESALPGVTLPEGWVHDRNRLRRYLSAADLYVFSSRWEGYPNALLEAMACGLPVVATEIAGVPDIVGQGDDAGGLLVPPDDPKSLSDAVGQLLDNADLRRKLARRARLRIDDRFSLDVVGAQMRDFFVERGMR
jgi:starch synthase